MQSTVYIEPTRSKIKFDMKLSAQTFYWNSLSSFGDEPCWRNENEIALPPSFRALSAMKDANQENKYAIKSNAG
jgi:hypothetical protein